VSTEDDDVTGDGREAARPASSRNPDGPTPRQEAADSGAADDADAATVAEGSAAGSARAAARRSAARASTTERKTAPTPGREATATERGNVFSRIGRFLREVVAELRKVIWPTRKQMITYTIVVIIFVSFMVALVAGLDVLFARAVLAIFG
jgi:preprotein translocase subunit SecE